MLTNEPKPKISSVFSRETMLYILNHKFKPKKISSIIIMDVVLWPLMNCEDI